jgi:DNA-binding IclR family transcriptional regulator
MNVQTTPRKVYPCDSDIPAVARAVDLLELVVSSERGLTLSEVSQKLGIVKSSAHRLISSLLVRGYLQRSLDGRHYVLGMRALLFADAAVALAQLRTVFSPHAQRLAEESGLTVLGGVLGGIQGVVFLKVASPRDNYPGAFVGHHFDYHCTAMGKALVAFQSEKELSKIFREKDFPRHTPKTVSSVEQLKADLAAIRSRGYAINNEELDLGARAVAAPVFDHMGRVVASICVRGSSEIFPEHRIPICGREVMATAAQTSRDLLEFLPAALQS